jgi:pimeloyl-ACP methyl ester carboxylesterase
MTALPNIVLVHGAWADGSSWSAVIEHLQADGYRVTAPQFSIPRLADDVARLRQVLARQQGPTVVAGHSYGGQLITALGTDTPNVVGLVTIEIAGPEQFGLDELIRKGLSFRGDPREVVADPEARYYGPLLEERILLPGADALTLDPASKTGLFKPHHLERVA